MRLSLATLLVVLAAAAASSTDVRSQPRLRPTNVCRCEPPINSQARGPGACTRTQDGASFCDIEFPSTRTLQAAAQQPPFRALRGALPAFPDAALAAAVQRLDAGNLGDRDQAAASVRAAILLASNTRPVDSPDHRRFRDLLVLSGGQPDPAASAMAKAFEQFSKGRSTPAQPPLVQQAVAVAGSTHRYVVVATGGCIAFGEEAFVLMIRETADAGNCSPRR